MANRTSRTSERGMEKVRSLRELTGRYIRYLFAKFRIAIQSVAWQNGIDVVEVPAAKTSQRCPSSYIS
ncbi:MAG: hypothetical protein DRN25_02895 [Thermoplasmata archaeon]|nr:MAG: hypothetical protein DRN25_02895 [Thermoplasmata archaeon]